MKIYEATTRFYHGSPQPLKVGSTYRARKWTKENGVGGKVEVWLEKLRPANSLSRTQSFFMVDDWDPDFVALAGGSAAYIYQVNPVGRVEQHDIQWVNSISMARTKQQVLNYAEKYWSGQPYKVPEWSQWEYLTPSFTIVRLMYERL